MKQCFVLFVSIVAAGAGACGGSDLDPGAGDDPGKGTATLLVDGNVSAQPRLTNAREPADFDTELSVRVTLGQQPVTTGTVTVTSASGTFPLTYRPDPGRWEGSAPSYDEVYVLDVVSGVDSVEGVRVDGPDIHTSTAPTVGATVDSAQPLRLTWDSDQKADSASIDTERLDRVAIDDTGEYMLAGGALKAEKDKAIENSIQISRTNRVTPSGAVAGSELSVRIENRLQVVAQPNPTL
jgi:hypothetical protein